MFVRRAFNDPAGFLTGWVLLLDYIVVIALAALFVPHYFGGAVGWEAATREPWDGVLGIVVIVVVAGIRLVRRSELYRAIPAVALLAFATHVLLVVLGLALIFSPAIRGVASTSGRNRVGATSRSRSLSRLLSTRDSRQSPTTPRRPPSRSTLPRSLFGGWSRRRRHLPARARRRWSETWEAAGFMRLFLGIVSALDESLPQGLVDALRVLVGLSAVVVLIAAITTSISGAGRVTYALGKHDMLPRSFAPLSRRTLIAPVAIPAAGGLAAACLAVASIAGGEVRYLASLYSRSS